MAELTPIEYQQTSGANPDVADETQALMGAVGALVQAGVDIRKDDILGDFREDANTIIDEERENALTSSVFDGPSELSGEQGRIQRRARGLQATKEAGNSSQRKLAELELTKLLNETSNRFPGLARELAQEMNLVVNSSYKLEEIGMIDELRDSQAAMAAEELKAMADHGRDVLMIDPSIPIGSREFAKQYTERQAIWGLKQAHQFDLMLAATTADMDAQEKSQAVARAISNKGNIIDDSIDQFFGELVQYRAEIRKPNEQRNLDYMVDFTTNRKPAMREELNLYKSLLYSILPDVYNTPALRSSPTYEQDQLLIEDQIKRVDALLGAVDSDDADALDHVIAARRVRNMKVRQQNATYDRFATFIDPRMEGFKPFMETISKMDLTGGAVNKANKLAQYGLTSFNEVLGVEDSADAIAQIWHSSGQGTIEDTTSPANIKRNLMANWSGNEGFYGDANSTEEKDLERSVAHLEMMRQASADAVATKSPYTAGVFMQDATNALLVMATLGRPARNQIDATTAILADRNVFEAGLLEGNTTNKNRRLAMADAASEFYSTVEPAKLEERIKGELAQPYLGIPMKNLLSFRPNDGEDKISATTEMGFIVNEQLLKAQLEARMGGGIGEGQVKAHAQQLRELAMPIVNRMNEHIRASSHIDALQQPTISEFSSDYINTADQLGWIDYLMSPIDAE